MSDTSSASLALIQLSAMSTLKGSDFLYSIFKNPAELLASSKCICCDSPAYNPLIHGCGVIRCSSCSFTHNCDKGQQWISVSNIPLLKAQFDKIKAICSERGCGLIATRAEYLKHKEICGFKQVECDSCSHMIRKKDLEAHLKQCTPVPCPYCLQLVRPAELKSHEEDLTKCVGMEDFLRRIKHPLLSKMLKPPAPATSVIEIVQEAKVMEDIDSMSERMCTAVGCHNPRGIDRYVSQEQLKPLPVSATETHSTYLLVGEFASIQFPKDRDTLAVCETCALRVERAVNYAGYTELNIKKAAPGSISGQFPSNQASSMDIGPDVLITSSDEEDSCAPSKMVISDNFEEVHGYTKAEAELVKCLMDHYTYVGLTNDMHAQGLVWTVASGFNKEKLIEKAIAEYFKGNFDFSEIFKKLIEFKEFYIDQEGDIQVRHRDNHPAKIVEVISKNNKRKWEEEKDLKDKIMLSLGTRELKKLLRNHDIQVPQEWTKFTMVDQVAECIKNKKMKMEEVELLAGEDEVIKEKLLNAFSDKKLKLAAREQGLKFGNSKDKSEIAELIVKESKAGKINIDKMLELS